MATKRTWWFLTVTLVGMVMMSFGYGASTVTATTAPSGPQLREAMEDAKLATAVYDLALKDVGGVWRQIESKSDPDGFQAAVYEQRLPDGRRDIRIVFAGTNDPRDAVTNFGQGVPWWLGTADKLAAQQYARAQAFAAGYANLAKKDGSIRSLRAVGHSMGGMLVQYVSAVLDIEGTAFNASALVRARAELSTQQVQRGDQRVTHYYLDGDPIFPLTIQMPGAQHLGTIYRVGPSAEVGRATAVDAVKIVAGSLWRGVADAATGQLAGRLQFGHSMEAMSLSLDDVHLRTTRGSASLAALRDEQLSRVIAVPMETASLWFANTKVVADALTDMKHLYDKHGNAIVSDDFLRLFGESPERFNNLLEKASFAYGLVEAIKKDWDQFRGQPVVLMRSQVVGHIGEWVFDERVVPRLYAFLDDKGLDRVLSQQHLYPAADKRGTPVFGLKEFAKAGMRARDQGHWDVESITSATDGFVGLTWALWGLLASGGNLRVAQHYEEAGITAARTLRFAAEQTGVAQSFARGFWRTYDALFAKGDFGGRAQQLVSMYEMSQETRAYSGVAIQTFTEWLEGDGSKQVRRGAADEIKKSLAFRPQDNESVARAEARLRAIAVRPSNAIDGASGARGVAETVRDAQLAVDLARPGSRVVLVGSGPLADRTYDAAARRFGADNVRRVPFVSSTYERNRVVSDFGADTVIRVSEQRYREVTEAGVRRVLPLPSAGAAGAASPPPPPPPPPPAAGSVGGGGRSAGPDQRLGQGIATPSVGHLGSPLARALPSFSPPKVGGVMLEGAAEAQDAQSQLTAGNFSLMFHGDGEIGVSTLRKFVTALWATYFSAKGPGISIDPIPGVAHRHVVRYIGHVVNSDLARVMREADYRMKEWSVGSASPDLPDFLNPDQIAARNRVVHVGAASRFWFVPKDFRFRRAGNALMFDDGAVELRTEYLVSKKGSTNPENEEFAAQFTRRYPEVAERYPVFEELFEYAKLVSLSRYLKDRGVPLLWFLLANREMALTEDSPGTVKAFAKRSEFFEHVHIEGGVDLSGKASVESIVVDRELLKALAEARRSAPTAGAQGHASGRARATEVVDGGGEALVVTPAETVVPSDSRSTAESFATDFGLRRNGTPHLEVARHRRSYVPRVETFGRDWHLMIPYSVRPGSPARVAFRNARVPETMTVRNELTGREETMVFNTDRYDIAGYVPERPESSVSVGLFFLTNGTLRLVDKLGSEFQFDEQGRLIEMILAPDYRVQYKYGSAKVNWRRFNALPYRLDPDGVERVVTHGASLPVRLRLADIAMGQEEVFEFAKDNSFGVLGYTPVDRERSEYQFLAMLSDGSLVLEHKSGSQLTFDRGGRFSYLVQPTVATMTQGSQEVRFEYDVAAGRYRIVAAGVFDKGKNEALYGIEYRYGRDGALSGSAVKASPQGRKVSRQE